jgi:hypothetical protein
MSLFTSNLLLIDIHLVIVSIGSSRNSIFFFIFFIFIDPFFYYHFKKIEQNITLDQRRFLL